MDGRRVLRWSGLVGMCITWLLPWAVLPAQAATRGHTAYGSVVGIYRAGGLKAYAFDAYVQVLGGAALLLLAAVAVVIGWRLTIRPSGRRPGPWFLTAALVMAPGTYMAATGAMTGFDMRWMLNIGPDFGPGFWAGALTCVVLVATAVMHWRPAEAPAMPGVLPGLPERPLDADRNP